MERNRSGSTELGQNTVAEIKRERVGCPSALPATGEPVSS